MDIYEAIYELLTESRASSDLIKKVTKLDDNYMLLDCNFAKSARLHVVGNKVYIEADEELKSKLKQLINKLLKRR